jgi:hypothetical protein
MARVTITLTDSKKTQGQVSWKMVCRADGADTKDGSAAFAAGQKMIATLPPSKPETGSEE